MFKSTAQSNTTTYTKQNKGDAFTFSKDEDNEDHTFTDERLGLAGAEYQGTRTSQEDEMDFAEIPGFELLSHEQQNRIITDSINDVQTILENATVRNEYEGSCLLTNILLPAADKTQYELITVSLGDSLSYLATTNKKLIEIKIKDPSVDVTHVERLNKLLHKPTVEKERLSAFPHSVKNKRLGGTLAVSGAIGDVGMKKYGLTQTPHISRCTINKEDPDNDINLITACDGIEPLANWIGEMITEKIREHRDSLEQMAKELAFDSIFGKDNVSVVVTRVNNRKVPLTSPLAISVYDGHGGDVVAKLLSKIFLPIMIARTRLELKKSSLLNVSIMDYVQEIEMAFNCIDNPAEFFTHIKIANAIRHSLSEKTESVIDQWHLKFFTPASVVKHLYEKDLNLISLYVDFAIDEYIDNPKPVSQVEILRICKEIRATHLSQSEPDVTLTFSAPH